MSKKLRVGIIGTGSISHSHMAGYKRLGDRVELVANECVEKANIFDCIQDVARGWNG